MTQNTPLDRIDFELLAALAKDARLANKELAARVGLAPSTVHARVARLVREGYLRGFHADVDLGRLGFGIQAMIRIQLREQGTGVDALARRLLAEPEVLELYHVSGSEDLLLRVVAADTQQLRELIVDRLFEVGEARHVETSIVFEHRRSDALPLPALDAG